MANVLSLAMKVSADASSVPKQLTPVERALANLGKESDKATATLDKLARSSAAAAAAQVRFATDFAFLTSALKTQQITAEQYAAEFAKLQQEVRDATTAFAEGAVVQARYGNALSNSLAEIERLTQFYKIGAIDLEALNNASIEALGIDKQAAQSARERADAVAETERQQAAAFDASLRAEREAQQQRAALEAEAQRLRDASLTAQEQAQKKFDAGVARASELEQQGVFTKQDFNRELERQAGIFAKATVEAGKLNTALDNAGDGGTLKFNELSGILAALPGPIGNVAGRLSGLSSAGEGLSRVFAGGVSQGIGSVGSAVAGLVNPFTIGAAAVTGLGLAAVGIARGLGNLEQQVEQLSNSALRLGTDFGTVQVLDEAARRTGQSLDALASGLQRFSINVDEARSGSGKAAEAFSELGISQEQLRDTDPTTLAQQAATALQGIEDPARRAALATETLGKSGLSLLPAFNAIEEARQSMERFQTAISDVDAERIGGVGQAFDNLNAAFAGLTQNVLTPFAGLVSGITNLFADLIGLITRLAQAIGTVLTPVLDAIGETLKAFGDGIAFVSGWFDTLLGNSEKTQPAVANLRAEIEEPLQDNFAKEFQRTLDDITKSVSNAIDESAKFGDAGFDAAVQYQEQIAKLKEQLDAGLFNEETFRREAAKAGDAFRQELDRLSDEARLEIQIEEDAQRTLAGLNAEVDKAIKKAAEFGQEGFDAANQFQSKIDELRRQFDAGIINDEALKQGVEAVNAEYDKQIDKIKQVQEEQKKLVADQDARVDALLQSQSETAKIEQQILDVQQTAARVADEAAKAREAGNAAAADGATARLAQLDQLEAQLDEKLQAAEQGFGEAGFGPAFQAINDGLNDSAEKASEFGNAGAQAFAQLQAGVQAAQQQAKDGILNQEALDQQVAAQQKAFDQEIKNIEEAAKRREDVQKQVDQMIFDSLDEQQQAQIKAAENIKVLEEEKAAVQAKLAAARDANDKEAIKAGQQRLAQIDKLAAKEQDVASGAAGQREKFLEQQKKVADAQQKQQEAFLQEQQKAAEERQKAEEAEYNRQVERIAALNTLGSRTVQTADVRTAEGQQIVFDLLNQEQDPQLIAVRQTNRLLGRIAASIDRDLNRLGQPALILP
jgi:hypothetical protein